MTKNSEINYEAMVNRAHIVSNISSAETIVPLLIDLIHPSSIVDLGCATGVWLNEFRKRSDTPIKVNGVDGAWVLDHESFLSNDEFKCYDFEDSKATFPLQGERYDLAISLEMAEHISKQRAEFLVDTLTSLSNIVYFSAATPFSGGMHHVNERWQSWWMKKFIARGYVMVDAVRPAIWNERRVAYFYAQESFIYISKTELDKYPKLKELSQKNVDMIDVVHPELFINQVIKPSHDWDYLRTMLRKTIKSMVEKAVKGY